MHCSSLRLALVTTLCALPATAWAGGGATGTSTSTGTGTGTDTGTGSDTGTATDTGTGSDTGTATDTGSGSSTGQECSECSDSPDPVQIVEPADGDTVGVSVLVRVTAPYTCACDGCACAPRAPFNMSLRVDGTTVANCQSDNEKCNTEDQTFVIELEPGTYTLDALAEHDGSPEFSAPIMVTVPGATDDTTGSTTPPPPPPPPASTGDSGSDSTGAPAADGGGGGCGCRAHDPRRTHASALLGLLALFGLGAVRRRRC